MLPVLWCQDCELGPAMQCNVLLCVLQVAVVAQLQQWLLELLLGPFVKIREAPADPLLSPMVSTSCK